LRPLKHVWLARTSSLGSIGIALLAFLWIGCGSDAGPSEEPADTGESSDSDGTTTEAGDVTTDSTAESGDDVGEAGDVGDASDVLAEGGGDAGDVLSDAGPPTVTITAPAADTKLLFTKDDACQSKIFTASFTAPAGLKTLQFKFVTPDSTKATTAMVGTCTGTPAYGYTLDGTKDPTKVGATSGTVNEDVAIAGLYGGTGGLRWWWCTPPGTSTTGGTPTAFVNAAPAAGAAGVQTLSNYCYAKTAPPSSDTGSRWQLQVTVTDNAGATATASLFFWLHL